MKSLALAPLRHGPFARYISGESISMVGTWMQTFAQGWVLTSLTSSAFVLGAINFTSGLPMLLLTLAGGSAADRYDKRLIIQAALATQFLSAAAIGWLVFTNQIAIWHVFAAALVLGVAAAFEVPAVSALVPELVPPGEMAQAIAIDRSVFHATRLIGPAVGGYLVAALGVASAYFVNAVSFVPLAAAVFSIPRRPAGTAAEEELRRGSIGAGIAYVRADPPTRAMVLLIAAATVFISPFVVIMMPIYARITLGLGPDGMGLLMAVSGIGSLVGSIGVLSIPHGRRALALKCGAAVVSAGMCGLAAAPSFRWAVAALIPMLVGLSTCFSVANIVIQERAPNELRGRVSAVAALSFFGLIPFSGILLSLLIDHLGMRTTMFGSAIGYALAAGLLLFGRHQLAAAPPVPIPPPEAAA
jgi:MFS family permease